MTKEELPARMGKAEFAMMIYNMDDPEKAADKLRKEYANSPALQEELEKVGYNKYCKELRKCDMKVFFEILLWDDE